MKINLLLHLFFVLVTFSITLNAQVINKGTLVVYDNLMPVSGETGIEAFEKVKMHIMDSLLFENTHFFGKSDYTTIARLYIEPDMNPPEQVLELIQSSNDKYFIQLKSTNINVSCKLFPEFDKSIDKDFLDNITVTTNKRSIPDSLALILEDNFRAAIMNIKPSYGFLGSWGGYHSTDYFFSVFSSFYWQQHVENLSQV